MRGRRHLELVYREELVYLRQSYKKLSGLGFMHRVIHIAYSLPAIARGGYLSSENENKHPLELDVTYSLIVSRTIASKYGS